MPDCDFFLNMIASLVLRYYSKGLISVPPSIPEIQQSLVMFDPAFSFGSSSSLLRLIIYVTSVLIKYYCVVKEKTVRLWWIHFFLVHCINFHQFSLVDSFYHIPNYYGIYSSIVIRSSGPSGDVCICVNRKSKMATTVGNISNVFLFSQL